MAGRRRRTSIGILISLGIIAVGALLLSGTLLHDDTRLSEKTDEELLAWADVHGLIPNNERTVRRARRRLFAKWFSIERAFWYEPPQTRAALRADLGQLALSLELKMREESADRNDLVVALYFADGREVARVAIWRRTLVAICMDDIGYQMKSARRVARLPCPITCAVIPFTPYAQKAAKFLRLAGKEIFLHMPMESVVPLPDVPEYEVALRPGQDEVAIGVCVEKALAEIPEAIGLNNHEGSLVTEDWGTMASLMEVLRRHDLVFMDSATTSRTVAWKAAGVTGIKWAMRDIFIDHTLEEAAIESYFRKLVTLARRQGKAIGVCHPHRKTLDALERIIPAALADGVIFVPVSSLARRGPRPSRLAGVE